MKARLSKEALEMCGGGQRKREVQHMALIWKMATQRVGQDTPHRRALRCGVDTYGAKSARAENAAKLCVAARGIGEELQAELANDRVEAGVPEGGRVAIH